MEFVETLRVKKYYLFLYIRNPNGIQKSTQKTWSFNDKKDANG